MNGVIRSWQCLNARCGHEFTAWESNPKCPTCKCVRVHWIPGGGHVAGTAKGCDAELRALADAFKMPDIHSSARGGYAKQGQVKHAAVAGRDQPNMQFAPGFTAPLARDSQGRVVATCQPSTSHVNFKAKVAAGVPLPHSRSVPGVHAATAIEASHRPPR